jgi:hypothetical protein
MAARSASSASGIHPLVFRKARRVLREDESSTPVRIVNPPI